MTDPKPELPQFKGRLKSIDTTKRQLVLEDKEGIIGTFTWPEPLDVVMRKWQPGYYLKPHYHDDTKLIKDCEYWQEGKQEMPKKPQGERKVYGKSPEERKDIRLMACLKSATELWQSPCVSDEIEMQPYEEVCLRITRTAVEMEKVLSGEGK